jgi:nucleotide sugar dehydrogenase
MDGGVKIKIQIIGPGVIGKATGEGFGRYGHDVWYVDKDDKLHPATFHFICVPEKEVKKVIEKMRDSNILGSGTIVVRSTITPAIYEDIISIYPHISHNPEFLRESVAEYEFMTANRVIIGECCKEHGMSLDDLYKPFQIPIIHTKPLISIMVKLTTNAYLSTTISFWNEIKEICDGVGINSHKVGSIVSMDPRIPTYGAKMHGKPFGGKCLPKDLDQMLELYEDSILLKAVKEVNERLKHG